MSDPHLNADALKTHGGRRPGAGRKPTKHPAPSLETVTSEPPVVTLAGAWQRASDDERRTFVREHRAWFGFYGG